MREENNRKPVLRNALELRHRLESTRTQERRERITDAANEAEQALYNVLKISPPESNEKPTATLAPRKQRVKPGRVFMAWLERKALDNVRSQLSLLVSTPSHRTRAQNREAKQQASIWASRYATHAVVLILLLGIAAFGGFKGLTVQAASVAPGAITYNESKFEADISASFNQYDAYDGNAATKADISERAQIITSFPERVKGYTVQQGDTLASLATKFNLDKPTLMWANHLADPDADLTPGQTLIILPVKGMYHVVTAGDTVESVAAEYQVEPAAITSYKPNQLQPPYVLNVGDALVVPGGQIPARDNVITYQPHPGETLDAVAQKFGLNTSTLLLANPDLGNGSALSSDSQLLIPPIDGIIHNVVAGDTIESIAAYYGVSSQVLVDFAPNHLKMGQQLTPDTIVMVPGGALPTPTPQPTDTPAPTAQPTATPKADKSPNQQITSRSSRPTPSSNSSNSSSSNSSGISITLPKPPTKTPTPAPAPKKVSGGSGLATGHFIWPADGVITQYFWTWEAGRRHHALDIANVAGTPIYAADGGTVSWAGWRTDGLGYCVMIDHGNGYTTIYGHMRRQPSVWVGEKVSQGQYLGPMGSTGWSTGPHTHFMIELNGVPRDPLNYLK